MADNGLRGSIPTHAVLTTTLATVWTVPTGKEWTARSIKATNISASDATVSITIASGYVAYNYPVKVGLTANAFGPDTGILPAGTVIQARASAASAIDLTGFFDERDV